ncbi:MAG: phosphatidylethanolamine N-methyltransferase [Bacteroidetes bacterium GWA2_30_7]|nr:MAG: phosphatidylethanolamine N-methyltransferase [Bacteroidetes bacterium GWA2_30_7]
MKINTNTWNKIRYTIYTPIYDSLGRIFAESRKKSISSLEIKDDDRVLIIGAGTGLDLEFLNSNCEITATDITPAMIKKLSKRGKLLKLNVDAKVMDGQKLLFPDNTFDKVILHLILAVIPDPVTCIKEAERVLKSGGAIAVFDKFVPTKQKISFGRRVINLFTNFLFSDITRSFEKIIAETKLITVSDEKADFGGIFRIITLRKN